MTDHNGQVAMWSVQNLHSIYRSRTHYFHCDAVDKSEIYAGVDNMQPFRRISELRASGDVAVIRTPAGNICSGRRSSRIYIHVVLLDLVPLVKCGRVSVVVRVVHLRQVHFRPLAFQHRSAYK